MKKISTLFYSINDFEEGESQIFDMENLISDDFGEYNDVYKLLNETQAEPSNELVEKIINFSKTIE